MLERQLVAYNVIVLFTALALGTVQYWIGRGDMGRECEGKISCARGVMCTWGLGFGRCLRGVGCQGKDF